MITKLHANSRFLKFVLAGLFNTGATYLLYLALLQITTYPVAYSLTYIAGIAIGYFVNVYFVFDQSASLGSLIRYPAAYLGNYVLGIVLLWLFVTKLSIPQQVAPLLVLVITTPVMYLMSRHVFAREEKQ